MSVLLMVIAIIALLSFQAFWLYKNFQEEKQNLRVQTNILFREAVYHCQAKKMKLDTSIKFRHPSPGAVRVVGAIQNRLRDTIRYNDSHFKVRIKKDNPSANDSLDALKPDSTQVYKFITSSTAGEKTIIEFLETAEASQDSITTKEIAAQYQKMLTAENIGLPFTITRFTGIRKDDFMPPDLGEANEVSIGILHPLTFVLTVKNTVGYILRKMMPIIVVSFLLIGFTVLSFALLLRNFLQQRKLTQLKNDFISNITHELKTPIATVSVAIEAMKDFNVLDNRERTREYLSISANELQRLSLLVDKVLRISMFEKKEIEFKKELFDLSELAREVMNSMKLQFEKQDANVSIELSGNNFRIEADKRHIASVIYNLLDNALKYSNGKPTIRIHLIDQGNFLELRISDNGLGIPKEYSAKIFEQFFRVPSGDRHNTKGYGLGLSYVNHIVKSHQGFIEVDSQLYKGSTFIIKLPFAEAPVIYYDNNRSIRKISFRL